MGSSGALPNTTGSLVVGGTVTAADLVATDDATVGDDLGVTGDATVGGVLRVTPGATIELGADTNLYRTAANRLATDDALDVGGNLLTFGSATVSGDLVVAAGAGSFGGGAGVAFIHNATTNPTTNPTAGGILYVTAGALTYRGSSGTVTPIAPA
jgi:ethanolamine utilization microcompartment shell protein EutS